MINLIFMQILNYSLIFSKGIEPDIVKTTYSFQLAKGSSESEINSKFSEFEQILRKSNYEYEIIDSRVMPLYIIEENSDKKVISGYTGYFTIEFTLVKEDEIKKLNDFLSKQLKKSDITFELKGTKFAVSDSLLLKEKLNYMKEILNSIKNYAKLISENCSIERIEFQDAQPTINLAQISNEHQKNNISFITYITLNCNDKIENTK